MIPQQLWLLTLAYSCTWRSDSPRSNIDTLDSSDFPDQWPSSIRDRQETSLFSLYVHPVLLGKDWR